MSKSKIIFGTNEETSNIAQKIQKENQLKDLTATLVVEGNVLLTADIVIEVEGVLAIHSGKWYVEKVTHSISKSGFITTLELNKNATRKPATTQVNPTNNFINEQKKNNFPTKKQDTENPKQVQRYDGYGNIKR